MKDSESSIPVSTRLIMSCCIVTASTANLPAADSADNITASEESNTAVATSLASSKDNSFSA